MIINYKKIAKLLYINNNNIFIEEIIKNYTLEKLLINDSIKTLLIKNYISLNNNNLLEFIINNKDIKLCKRDYLSLINYYYNLNYNKSLELLLSILNNNIISFENKDLDFMINKKLFKCIFYLNNFFLVSQIKLNMLTEFIIIDNSSNILNLKLLNYDFNNNINKLKIYLESIIKINDNDIDNNNYDFIIDSGNILHYNNGIIDNKYLNNFEIIYNIIKNDKKILFIIHIKHIKKCPNIINFFKDKNLSYYLTPYNYNDDLYILWFFIKTNFKSFIVSNDKFDDFINNLNINNILNKNDLIKFNFILKQQILNYSLKNNFLKEIPLYSNCIQIVNNIIYIPHINNKIIKINLI